MDQRKYVSVLGCQFSFLQGYFLFLFFFFFLFYPIGSALLLAKDPTSSVPPHPQACFLFDEDSEDSIVENLAIEVEDQDILNVQDLSNNSLNSTGPHEVDPLDLSYDQAAEIEFLPELHHRSSQDIIDRGEALQAQLNIRLNRLQPTAEAWLNRQKQYLSKPYALELFMGAWDALNQEISESSLAHEYPDLPLQVSLIAADLPDIPRFVRIYYETLGKDVLFNDLIQSIVDARQRQAVALRHLAYNIKMGKNVDSPVTDSDSLSETSSEEENFKKDSQIDDQASSFERRKDLVHRLYYAAKVIDLSSENEKTRIKNLLKKFEGISFSSLHPEETHLQVLSGLLSQTKGEQGELIFYLMLPNVKYWSYKIKDDPRIRDLMDRRLIHRHLFNREIDLILQSSTSSKIIFGEVKHYWNIVDTRSHHFKSLLSQLAAQMALVKIYQNRFQKDIHLHVYIVRGITARAKEIIQAMGIQVFSRVVSIEELDHP